jgi:hypothetical protein
MLLALLCSGSCTRASVRWNSSLRQTFSLSAGRPTDPPYRYWEIGDEELFLQRAGFADIVALGEIRLVRRHTHLEKPLHIAYGFRPLELLHGDLEAHLDDTSEIMLTLARGSDDFRLAIASHRDSLGEQYLLMLKEVPSDAPRRSAFSGWRASLWQAPTAGARTYVWALYRPEPELLAYLRRLFDHYRRHGP